MGDRIPKPEKASKPFIRLFSLLLAVVLVGTVWTPWAFAAASAGSTGNGNKGNTGPSPRIQMLAEEPVAAGTVLKKLTWRGKSNGEKSGGTTVYVLQVDLRHPYVKLDVMTGSEGQFTKLETVKKMAVQTGAVAGVNGDFFDMKGEGAPIGPQMSDGEVMASPSLLPGLYAFALTEDKEPIIERFAFSGTVTAADGSSYPLAGINKTTYWIPPDNRHSHADALYLYTSAWGSTKRANDGMTVPTEVLVEDGVVREVKVNGTIETIPSKDGYILRASGKAADFVSKHIQPGDPLDVDYELLLADPAKKNGVENVEMENIEMMIGGHTILVEDGKPAAFSRDVRGIDGNYPRSRTAVGYSKDKKYVYLIAVEGGESQGMKLDELQQLMVELGIWKGMNLDGGGSTQIVARPLGEFAPVLVNRTEYGGERKVVNGIGIFSTAPRGKIIGQLIKGNPLLFVKERTEYEVRQYDEYYNPVIPNQESVEWSVSGSLGKFENNAFIPLAPGKGQIIAKTELGEARLDVEVIGRNRLARLAITAPQFAPVTHTPIPVSVQVTTKDGRTRTLPSNLVEWELMGMEGKVEDGKLIIEQITGNRLALIARYDGFGAMLSTVVGETKTWWNLDDVNPYMITGESYPEDVNIARVSVEQEGKNRSLGLAYDFTQTTGVQAAYAVFGKDGAAVPGQPQVMYMDVWGDGSGNWIRMEMVDGKGNLQKINFAEKVDWKGWKTLQVNLSSYQAPLKIRSIYIRNQEEGKPQGAPKGQIRIDNIRFLYKGKESALPKTKVALTVGKKTILVNGAAKTLEQPPEIINDYTYVPVRFVVEAMGGEVFWDGKKRKVTVLRGNRLVELFIGESEIIVDGRAVKLDTPPLLRNNWTMLPLRGISEAFGWKITWNEKTRTVTLE